MKFKINTNNFFNYFKYIQIIKPKIILGNIISILGGFLLASKGNINFILLFYTLLGSIFVISSACILNNIIDSNIDCFMERTKNRIFVKNPILIKKFIIYSIILLLIGLYILYIKVNKIVFYIIIIGFLFYIFFYSIFSKRKLICSTFIGSISGATPISIGYCSVTNKFNLISLTLIVIYIIWQIPHFYSISIFRSKDFKRANIPTFQNKFGNYITKNFIIFYIINFILISSILFFLKCTGYKYLIINFFVSLYWLYISCKKCKNNKEIKTLSKKIFIYSIFVIIFFNILISYDYIN